MRKLLERTPRVWPDNYSLRRLSRTLAISAEARNRVWIKASETLSVWTKGNRTGQQSNLAKNMLYFSRKGKNGPEGDSEISGDATPTTGPECTSLVGQVCFQLSFKTGIRTQQNRMGRATPQSCGGDSATQCAWRAEYQPKEDYSQALRSNGIGLMRFWTGLGPVTLFSLFLPFGIGMSVLCLYHHWILEAHNLPGSTGS